MRKCLLLCMVLLVGVISSGYSEEWINYGNQNWITCSAQEGSDLWVGTLNGLVKLNTTSGQKTYYGKTNSGLSDMNVVSIMVDSQGKKWIGTENGGLCCLNGTTWTVWNTSNSGIPSNYVNGIASDTYNNIWMTTNRGLGRLSNGEWTNWNEANSDLPVNYLSCIAIDNSGTKWIGSGNGVISFSGNAWNHLTTGDGVSAISIDNQGNKWFGFYSNGLAKLQGTTWTYYNPGNSDIPDVTVECLATDNAGNVWLCTEEGESSIRGGLTKFNGTTWTTWNTNNSNIPIDIISSITIVNETNIWTGMYSKGMVKFDGTNWNIYDLANSGILSPSANCIEIDNLGRKWIGSEYGLSMFVGNNWTTWDILDNEGHALAGVSHIAVDLNNIVWIESDNGETSDLYSYNGTTWTLHQPSEFGLTEMDIGCIKTDNLNNKWIGGWFGASWGLIKFNGTNHTIYNSANSPINSSIVDVDRDAYGNIWVATNQNGLLQYNGSVWTALNTSNSNIPSNVVTDIAIDSFGNKWLATSNGLCRYDDLTFTNWNKLNSNIPNEDVISLEIGLSNKVWLITTNYENWQDLDALSCFDGNIWTNWTGANSPMPYSPLSDMHIDGFGNKWIVSDGGGLSVFNENEIVSVEDELLPNISQLFDISVYPNPFNLATKINYTLPKDGYVKATIFNVKGQLVKTLVNQIKNSGTQQITWDGFDQSGHKQTPGVYFIKIESNENKSVKKMVLLK